MDATSPSAGGGPAGDDRAVFAAALSAVHAGLATFDLTVLPIEETEAGLFIYDEATIDLVKDLKVAGIDAGFANPADERRFYSERSAEIAVSFLINIASAAVWDAFMTALQRYRGKQKLSITLVDEKQADGSERHTATFEGPGDDVLAAMRIHWGNQGGS